MTLEAALLIAITALVGVIGVLWRRDINHQAKRDAERKADVTHLREDIGEMRDRETDLVKRIRNLEEAHLNDVRTYAERYERLARDAQHEARRTTEVMRRLVELLGNRRCLLDTQGEPSDLPQIETDAITRKDQNHA